MAHKLQEKDFGFCFPFVFKVNENCTDKYAVIYSPETSGNSLGYVLFMVAITVYLEKSAVFLT